MYHRKSNKDVKNFKKFVTKPVVIEEIEVFQEKKVITEEIENNLVELITDFVKEEGLTINNVREAMRKVSMHMEDNATL